MAMRKNDIEQANAKKATDDTDDFIDDSGDDSGDDDEIVDNIEAKLPPGKDPAARKRLEDYLEEKRLRKELDDDLFD